MDPDYDAVQIEMGNADVDWGRQVKIQSNSKSAS